MKVPLCFPPIDVNDIRNVVRVLQSGQLVQGSQVELLERHVAALTGVEHAVAVSSGTATLHLALLSLNIGPGDEVVVPAFSFVATANVVELVGASPVFVDVDPRTFNIDPDKIKTAITPRTKAIMPVHEFGYPCAMDRIRDIADIHGLPVVEDAACALGSEWRGRKVGAWGRIGSFSFHPRKAVTSGEGGMLTTGDKKLSSFFRIMRNHGHGNANDGMDFVAAGFNYRMTDIQAALVVGQIERLEEIVARRHAIANRYDKELQSRFFQKPEPPLEGRTTWQSYHIVLDRGIDRASFLAFLAQKGIGAGYGAQCIPVLAYYRKKYGYTPDRFPEAYKAFHRGVVLPVFDVMSDDQVSYVVETINDYRS